MSWIKRLLFWEHPRASWQYDIIVGLILAFIFLTPRDFFRDQPRASDIVRLASDHGTPIFWVEPELLSSIPEEQRGSRVEQILKSRYGKRESVVRLEPIKGAEGEVKGYMAFTKP